MLEASSGWKSRVCSLPCLHSFFVQNVYRVRGSWDQGPEHTHLLLYIALAVGFAWFSVSSFTRAYRKSKRGPGAGS
jgi:hypothetical protein